MLLDGRITTAAPMSPVSSSVANRIFFHHELGFGKARVVVARVRLDGADQLGASTRRLDVLGGVDGVPHGLVVMLLPVEIVEESHDAPELLVLGVVLAGEVAHGLLDGLAVLDVEGVVVVLREQVECGLAGQAGVELCHGSS